MALQATRQHSLPMRFWAQSLLRKASVFSLVSLAGCVSWLDSEAFDREVKAGTEVVASALVNTQLMRLDHLVQQDAVYEVQCSPGRSDAAIGGMAGASRFGVDFRDGDKVVLRKGVDVALFHESPDPDSHLRLVRHSHLSSEIVEEQDPILDVVDAGYEIMVRRSALTKHQLLSASERVRRTPTDYFAGGSQISAGSMDMWQVVWWAVFPPIEIGRLVSRAFGARLERPTNFTESVIDRSAVPTDKFVAIREGRGGVRIRWVLTWGQAGRVEGALDLAEEGLYRVPLEDHEGALRQDMDIHRYGKLVVTDEDSGAELVHTIDIMNWVALTERARSGGQDGR